MIHKDYIERVYSGWLGKVIGVRYGAPVEMWTNERIESFFGNLNGYVQHFEDFAADDDTNGPMFFIRALEDYGCKNLSADTIGKTVLNYVPFEHSFFWWGGYGLSSEHTMYLNLRNGIPGSLSGLAKYNGKIIANQIGGQIFIDSWGFVCPGDYEKASLMAKEAAKIAWDEDGMFGGMFIASCISAAFEDSDIKSVINKALSVIPQDSDYAKVVKDVVKWYDNNPKDWKSCLAHIKEYWWMDKFIGCCHIIPNAAIIILSLLYGKGNFTNSLNICNMCGFDTDCNAGNVGAILGVLNGIDNMDIEKWSPEIHDFQAASSVLGCLNITDVADTAMYFARLGYTVMGEKIPESLCFNKIAEKKLTFEIPYSTHAVRAKIEENGNAIVSMYNTNEDAYTGKRCLKVCANPCLNGQKLKIFVKTYYAKEDFSNGRYEPVCSPIAYPGQTISVALKPDENVPIKACLFAKNKHTNENFTSEISILPVGQWTVLTYKIPAGTDALISEIGILAESTEITKHGVETKLFVDDFSWYGLADYKIDFSKEHNWGWQNLKRDVRTEISQFTRLKGVFLIEDNKVNIYSHDFAECYTGDVRWDNYKVTQQITPVDGSWAGLNFRVQGAARSYAAVITNNALCLYKNIDTKYNLLCSVPLNTKYGKTYSISAFALNNKIELFADGKKLIDYCDNDNPYLNGCIGMSTYNTSHAQFGNIEVTPV